MRIFSGCALLALLALGCSSGEDGPRGWASAGAGGSAAGMAPMAGSTSNLGGGGSSAMQPTGDDTDAHVMTWVPPYRVVESRLQLSASFDGVGMADGLSYLGLQFWVTDGPGTHLDQVSEADITWFHDWARQHGVKVLLCVHNHTGGDWNWPEAVRSFRDNREAFAQHLVSEVMTRDLDGVDLDLEGIVDATEDDRLSYKALVETLSGALHPLGKVLTMDSFHGQWNAPNWNWWPDLLPLVDGITSMGYEQSGMGVDYQELVDHAALAPQKLMIGVPSYHGTWLNHSVTEQLGWIIQQGKIGTSIWDASLSAPEWRQAGVWQQLKTIKSR